MTRPKPSALIIGLVLVVLISTGLACSLLGPQAASTTSVENLLATMTLQVWTPTSPATQTPLPTPTEAFTSTPTETPLPTQKTPPTQQLVKGHGYPHGQRSGCAHRSSFRG
jgi:hypothetical protein